MFEGSDFFGYAHDDDPDDSLLGPTVDSKLDEDDIWDFPLNSLNKQVVVNEWLDPNEDLYR